MSSDSIPVEVSSSAAPPQEKKNFKKRRPHTFGVVLWTKKGDEWNWVLQKSVSSVKKDLKLDPCRGPKNGEESNAQAASRELEEETLYTFQIPAEQLKDEFFVGGLFHLRVEFPADVTFESVAAAATSNREKLASTTLDGWKNFEGVTVVGLEDLRNNKVETRPGRQVNGLLKFKANPDLLPVIALKRAVVDVDASKLSEGAASVSFTKFTFDSVVSTGTALNWYEPRPPREHNGERKEGAPRKRRNNRRRGPRAPAADGSAAPVDGSSSSASVEGGEKKEGAPRKRRNNNRNRRRGPRTPADGSAAPVDGGSAPGSAEGGEKKEGTPRRRFYYRRRGPRPANGSGPVDGGSAPGSAEGGERKEGTPQRRFYRRGPRAPAADGSPVEGGEQREGAPPRKRNNNNRNRRRGPRAPAADGAAPTPVEGGQQS